MPGTSWIVRLARDTEDLWSTLGLERRQNAGCGAGTLRRRRQKAGHLFACGSPLLSVNQIGDVPAILGPLLRLRGFAQIEVGAPVIRHGKSGHFYNKGLEGAVHHAVIPNVNVLDDLESRLGRLSDDEKRLFALICRSYLAATMPDYEYRQTVVTMMCRSGGPGGRVSGDGAHPIEAWLEGCLRRTDAGRE